MSKTRCLVIQIGNSDNKLLQNEWSEYVNEVSSAVRFAVIHFFGGSPNWEPWQNACWVIAINDDEQRDTLFRKLQSIAKNYNQESIAIIEGDAFMLESEHV